LWPQGARNPFYASQWCEFAAFAFVIIYNDLATGTSNGAFAIADDGTIVGRGLFNGQLTAFAMRPISSVPEPSSLSMIGLIAIAIVSRRRRD
jgi:hypothetical protein